MPDLSRDLRRALASTIEAARAAAEAGAADALRRLGVFNCRRPVHLDDARNETRKRLRAHAKSLGDRLDGTDGEPLRRLIEATAYVQWHRLLFSRFLLERGLLRDETGVALSLSDCREEAATEGSGDEWSVAAIQTARMLPGVFPAEDPVEALVLAPEHAKALRDLLLKLDAAVFQADDSLGWTYQFWRAAEKKAINESGRKIGAAELPAVTQLFTEPYMVRFLLHNTLGAWWAGKVLGRRPDLARDAADEDALRAACALPGYAWDFLRFVKEGDAWRPAAGVFPGWPVMAAALTVLDPCCGSGHFLTEALAALASLRGTEEALSPADAVLAVLRDNLAGLEIDDRCVQIAAFALAVTAWRIGGPGLALPTPHVAWVGGPPPLPKAEFAALANGDAELRRGLEALHDLFVQAPTLGSLIEPVGGDLIDPTRVARIEDSIATLVEKVRSAEPDRSEGALAARGMADAASILARRFVLQATNVPFLGRGRQDEKLSMYLSRRFDIAKTDLATAMLERMRLLATSGGSVAAVTPQNWLFLGSYKNLREVLLAQTSFVFVVTLGSRCFETIGGEVVNAALLALTERRPVRAAAMAGFGADREDNPQAKSQALQNSAISILFQSEQSKNPSSIISPVKNDTSSLLSGYCSSFLGLGTGDIPRYFRRFGEFETKGERWAFLQGAVGESMEWGGCDSLVAWDAPVKRVRGLDEQERAQIHNQDQSGQQAWGKPGILVCLSKELRTALFSGAKYKKSTAVLVMNNEEHMVAVWCFVNSDGFRESVGRIDKKVIVANGSLVKVSFDLAHWQKVAAEKYPDGLPEPYSDDPTQWLFHGHPRHAAAGTELHVALARVSGYRWPAETDPDMRLSTEARARIAEAATLPPPDADGLLALVPVLGERALADRLRAFCVTAWGDAWTPNTEAALVAATCERTNEKPPRQLTLDAWLRTHAARQHAKLFHDRPFLWWITDDRADGFTAVAHYHRLTTGNLGRLAYTVLGDWIARLGGDPRAEAARVLQARLASILEGKPPYDIFVRWKPLHTQPLGWDPDLDDGVRLNIRPFIEAGVLAHVPNGIHYRTDLGKDVPSAPWHHLFNGERRNDHHTTLAEKQAARAAQAVLEFAGPRA